MTTHNESILFAGTSSARLAMRVSQHLENRLGRSFVEHFPDGEINIRLDEPVRGRDVFIIQSTCPPVSDNLVELLAFCDACRRSASRSITVVAPYFGYGRSDKRHGRREPIMASMVAELLETAGASHIVTLDLHAAQIEGFFHIPVDTLSALPLLAGAAQRVIPAETVIVSPDEGRLKPAAQLARWLRSRVVVLHKQRESAKTAHLVNVIGDVRGRPCLILDDMISTGATVSSTVEALLASGAQREIYVAATHGIFTQGAQQRLQHPVIKKIFISDSVPFAEFEWPQLEQVSIARLIASAIRRMRDNETMTGLYAYPPAVIDTIAHASPTAEPSAAV